MSWSRSYSGSPEEVLAQAEASVEEITATLPDFEKGDVQAAVNAAESALSVLDERAKVSLSLSGHGYRNENGGGAGSLSVSISYELAPAAESSE